MTIKGETVVSEDSVLTTWLRKFYNEYLLYEH